MATKTTPPTAAATLAAGSGPASTTTETTAGTAADTTTSAALPAAPSPVTEPAEVVDEFHGMGGAYEIKDGKRVLIFRTAEAASDSSPKPAA